MNEEFFGGFGSGPDHQVTRLTIPLTEVEPTKIHRKPTFGLRLPESEVKPKQSS